jgi:hypothetical protein
MKDQNRLLPEIDMEQELEYEEAGDECGADEDEDKEEEELDEEEIYCAALKAVKAHQNEMDLLYSATGMFWLGMSMGWKSFRVLHIRKSYSTMKILGVTKHSLVLPHSNCCPDVSSPAIRPFLQSVSV